MTETALLRAVARHPDEDTPRLAFADWLDENGHAARAEFVRAQVEYAATPADSPRRREVALRARLLLDAHEAGWLAAFAPGDRDLFWRRGFPETIQTTPADLAAREAALFDTTPFRRVWVWNLGGKTDALALVPPDNRVTALDLMGGGLNTNGLKKLAKFAHFPHVRELGLMLNELRDTAVNVLCDAPFFQQMAHIRLTANPISARGRDRLRDHFGNRVTFDIDRDPDRLHTIRDGPLSAVWGDDHTQLLTLPADRGFYGAVFDHAGTLLRFESQTTDTGGDTSLTRRTGSGWLREIGFRSGVIKVKRFVLPDRRGMTPFNVWLSVCHGHATPGRAANVAQVRTWLERGMYRLYFVGDDYWFDRHGHHVPR